MIKKFTILILLVLFLTGCTTPFGAIPPVELSMAEKYNQANKIKEKYQLDNSSLSKKEIKNAELDKYKNEPKDEIEVRIGDETQLGAETEFKPNIELKRWNEVGFKLKTDKLLANIASKDKKLKFEGEKIKLETPKMDFEMYDYTEGEGGFKYIWYLNEKPATNKIEFEIESEGLDFFYQPPLTEEYQNGYSEEFKREIIVSETQVKDLEGNVLVNRPVEAVGSWAIYHKTKGGLVDNNGKAYGTGKAFHIYRPHIIDANGLETWGKLHIENGIYSVEILQEFLNKAVYPIKSNDNFGYTTQGSAGWSGGQNYFMGTGFTSPADIGTLSSISAYTFAYAGGGNHNVKLMAVLLSNLNIVTNSISSALVCTDNVINLRTHTYSTAPTLSPSTNYVLGFISDSDYAGLQYDVDATKTSYADYSNNYTTPTNPTDAEDDINNFKYSIYATYTGETPPAEEERHIQSPIFFE